MAKPDDIRNDNDTRVRLDSDNAKRYGDAAGRKKVSRDWLVNHILRNIQSVTEETTIVMKPEGEKKKPVIRFRWEL